MFSNLNKSTFGTATTGTTFGLGASTTNAASPWGTTGNTQIFGKSAATGFGQTSTSFGQPSTSTNSMFPFFPQPSTSGFGTTTNNQSTFGANMFGQQQPANTNLFGSNTFGQQKTTGFGFGNQNQQQPNLFGQSAQPQNSLFQPSGSNNLFGSSNAFGSTGVGAGTTIKFNPVTGTDTMQKSGNATTINTKHHCITCMKEYEGKSLEELRLEDYQANRKGPQSQFGTAPFGSTPSMFGQTTENKPAFGQPTTSFGQIGGTSFGQQTQPTFGLGTQQTTSSNIFAKPAAFGTTSTPSNGFGTFNTNVTSTFGTNQPKPFGTTSATLFGNTQNQQQATPFGTSFFGQNNQNTTGGFFNKPIQTSSFGTGAFGFNQTPTATTTSNLFQPSKPVFGLGQTTSTGAFGQTPAFGQQNQSGFATSFGKPLTFGQDQSTFQNVGQKSLFANTQQKPGSLLGGSGGGIFGTSAFGNVTNTNFGLNQATIQPQISGFSLDASQDSKSLPLLASNQFGHSPFLTGLLPVDKPSSPTLYTTNPAEIKKMLENNKKIDETTSNYKKLKLKLGPPKTQRDNLFEEGNDDDINKFYKTSCKRLVLKKKQGDSKQSIFETNSIYNDLSSKNSENVLTSSNDISVTSEINSPRISEKENDLTRDNENTSFEIKFVNKNFSSPNSGKLITQKGLPVNNDSVMETPNDSQISLDNTIDRADVPKGLEEPLRRTVSNISVGSTDTDVTLRDPMAIRVCSEVVESESATEMLDSVPKNPSACGIILNRAEYYTLPPIEELDLLVSEDGRCLVKGFTVGRKGYGNVYFPEELDVRNLNLDEIVHFRYKEIHMYPDESKKAPVGEGLNRRAQVTLDRVYPRVKETKEIINDISQVLAAKFPEQLVEISSKHGLKFLDYRPETGSWVFMVEHFSKYAFTESDEEDCELSISKHNGKINVEKGSKILILDGKVLVPETKPSTESKVRPAAIVVNMDTDLASEYTDEGDQSNGDILHKSMTIDLEENEDDFINPIFETTDQDLFYHSSHIQMMKAAFFSDSECASTVSSTDYIGSVFKTDLITDKPKTYSRRPPQRPKVWKVYVNIASRIDDSVLLSASRCYSDLGVFKGKAFKVGWSRGFRNYTVKFPVESDFDTSISLSLRTVTSINNSRLFKESIKESIHIAHQCSDFSVEGLENIPTFAMKRAKTYLRTCYNIFNKPSGEFIGKSEGLYNDVWSLCNALWGVGRKSAPFVKQRLSSWLKSTVKDLPTEKDLSNTHVEDKLDVIFNHLTCFNVKEAAELAMKYDMPTLSMLISQMNLSQKSKAQMNQQLETWYSNMSADHISIEMMRIYLLLSGNLLNENVNVCEFLDWKRSFGVHLWYLTSDASPIQASIQSYADGFSRGDAVQPQPFYDTENMTSSYDILYQILQLYKNRTYRLVKALNPETYTNIKTDYQLSWLLLLFFQSINVGLIDDYEETLIHTSFSAQLEENDQWELAILPLLYLKDNSLKRNLLIGILNRHLTVEDNEKSKAIEAKLIEDFHIPSSWIKTVKAEKFGEMAYN